jgi:hypothetical protein
VAYISGMFSRGFLEGLASILEIQPEDDLPRRRRSKRRAPRRHMTDAEAIAHAWAQVGLCLRQAMDDYDKSQIGS